MTWRAPRIPPGSALRCPLCGGPIIPDPDQVPGRFGTMARLMLCIYRPCGAVVIAVILGDERREAIDREIKALARLSPRRN